MSNTPIKMNKLRQIIRLYCQGTGTKTINGMVGTSRTTIKKYLRIWHELGITHEEFNSRSDSELAVLFNTKTAKTINSPRMQELELLLPEYCKRLKKKGVTRESLHLEYILKLNLSTKEIATLMKISPRGVEIGRYRLRKKLNIPSNVNLFEFFNAV